MTANASARSLVFELTLPHERGQLERLAGELTHLGFDVAISTGTDRPDRSYRLRVAMPEHESWSGMDVLARLAAAQSQVAGRPLDQVLTEAQRHALSIIAGGG